MMDHADKTIRIWKWRIGGAVLLERKEKFTLSGGRKKIRLEAESLPALQKALQGLQCCPDVNWGNFRRGSTQVKEFLIASAAALYDSDMPVGSNGAVLCVSRKGSHEQNLAYFQDYVQFGRTSGRGQLFVATIPTTPMCESAISIQAHGPAYYLDTLDDPEPLYEDVELLLEEDETIPFVLVFFDFGERLHALVFRRGESCLEPHTTPHELFTSVKPALKSCCVIPVYNNASTVRNVVERALKYMKEILVVDDGSTDADLRELLSDLPVEVIHHHVNRGKGAALCSALQILQERSTDYMITLDGDNQHYPEDLPSFLARLEEKEGALLVGCRDFNDPNVPDSSRFGRKFSNFWMGIETGVTVDDCQSGFRAYPVPYIARIRCFSRHYNFETEILTRSAWANLPILNHPIRSYYPPRGERISHFRPLKDNFRISLVHLCLVLRHLLPIPHRKLIARQKTDFSLWRPKAFFHYLLTENASPGGLAAAAALGTFLAVLPLFGLHGAVILYAASCLHLNKLMAFNIQHLFMPPLAPFLCIELGYFLCNGRFLTEFTMETLVRQSASRIWEWFLGSLILAPLFAVLMGIAVYFIALLFGKIFRKKERAS